MEDLVARPTHEPEAVTPISLVGKASLLQDAVPRAQVSFWQYQCLISCPVSGECVYSRDESNKRSRKRGRQKILLKDELFA